MARLRMPSDAEMTPVTRRIVEEAAAGRRGKPPAPLAAWLKSPELAEHAQRLGAFVRFGTSLPPRLSELAILLTARHWTSHHEWQAHKREVLAAGLDPDAVAAIAARRRPGFRDDEERVAYDLCAALLDRHGIPDALYAEARAVLGEQCLVELVAVLGYYGLVSMTLNAFEIGLPEAIAAELLQDEAGTADAPEPPRTPDSPAAALGSSAAAGTNKE